MTYFDITIPILTPTFNQLLRMHFRVRAEKANEIAWLIHEKARPPAKPIHRARVTVYRMTTGTLDDDGLKGVAKTILDVLQPCSKKHPLGMGFIRTDAPDGLELIVVPVKSSAKTTRIVLEELQ